MKTLRWSTPLFALGLLFLPAGTAAAQEVVVRDRDSFRQALGSARAGTRILLAPGTYPGGYYQRGLQGTAERPIVIASQDPGRPAMIRGGGNGIQLSNAAYVEIRDLVFAGATGNGINIDDGGGPTRQITLRNLQVRDVGPSGNRDGIKLSGVTDFRIQNLTVERWGDGGSAIDMVGCHRGTIEDSVFRHREGRGGSGVQVKGGSSEVTVRSSRFEHAGQRAVNIGGNTDRNLFRPRSARAEARNIRVEGSSFIGSVSPVNFVGVDGATVRQNTFYRPGRWVVRILQETVAPELVPSRNGVFSENVVVFRSSELATAVNVGPNTAPDTFRFAGNVWYSEDNPRNSAPRLPTPEAGGITGRDPRLRNPAGGDLRLQPGSPAAGKGADASGRRGQSPPAAPPPRAEAGGAPWLPTFNDLVRAIAGWLPGRLLR